MKQHLPQNRAKESIITIPFQCHTWLYIVLCISFIYLPSLAYSQCLGTADCAVCNIQATVAEVEGASINVGTSNITNTVLAGSQDNGSPIELTATGCGEIRFSLTVNFTWQSGTNINWIHGIAFSNSNGWSAAEGSNPGEGWLFQNSITGCCSANTYGAGFYYDGTQATSECCGASATGDANDNWGIDCADDCPSFSFALAYCPIESGRVEEEVTFRITDDGETGGWALASNCQFDLTIPVIINAAGTSLPEGTIGPICVGESVSLDAGTGCESYLWSDGQSNSMIEVSPSINTVYCVTASSGTACETSSCVEVLTMPNCTANAGMIEVSSNNPCACSNLIASTSGYNTDEEQSQILFLTNELGTILEIIEADNGIFELSTDCQNYRFYAYNFSDEAAPVMLGMNVSALDCTDYCDLVSIQISTIDTEFPVFNNPPLDITLNCMAELPPLENLQWTDNCGGSGESIANELGNAHPCNGGFYTRTWEYTDACGNKSEHIQSITINPSPAPTFMNIPNDITVECTAIPIQEDLVFINKTVEACQISGTVRGFEIDNNEGCPRTIERFWEYYDACSGDLLMASQRVVVADYTPPIIEAAPADITVCIIEEIPPAIDLSWTDNCSDGDIVSSQDIQESASLISRQWLATDACGNSTIQRQFITIGTPQDIEIIGNTSICEGDTGRLEVSGSNLRTYEWSTGTFDSAISISTEDTYQVTVTNEFGCTGTASSHVVLQELPHALIEGDTLLCEGESTTLTASGGDSYYWSTGDIGAYTSVDEAGIYSVTVSANNCESETSTTLSYFDGGMVEVDLGADLHVRSDTKTQLAMKTNLPVSDIDEINWTPSTGLSCTDCPSPVAQVSEEIVYEVTLVSKNGCTYSDAIVLRIDAGINVYVPSAFSPNDDGINDRLTVFASPEVKLVDVFRIYDRWGSLVFEAVDFVPNDENFGWDGNFRGQTKSSAVFVWYAKVTKSNGRVEIFSGDVSLMR